MHFIFYCFFLTFTTIIPQIPPITAVNIKSIINPVFNPDPVWQSEKTKPVIKQEIPPINIPFIKPKPFFIPNAHPRKTAITFMN